LLVLTSCILLIAQACRRKVTGWLAKKFKTPLAEVHYNCCNSFSTVNAACAGVNVNPTTRSTTHNAGTQTDDVKSVLAHLFKALPLNKQLEFLSIMFSDDMLVEFNVLMPEAIHPKPCVSATTVKRRQMFCTTWRKY